MKKSDLKQWMYVKYRYGEYAVLIGDRFHSLDDYCYMPLEDYTNDLTENMGESDFDIVAIYDKDTTVNAFLRSIADKRRIPQTTLIWEKEEAKAMTHSEIEKALGYKIKYVKI
jgi:hypothetical protein